MANKGHDVLVTGSGSSTVGRQVARSLSRRGIRVCFTDNFRKLNEHDYVRQIKEVAAAEGVRMIVPIFDPQLLSRHRQEFPDMVIPVDDAVKIDRLDDKLSACSLASELGILQPRIYGDVESVDHYPVVFKRVDGHGGDSVYFPKLRKSLENLVRSSRPGSYLITEEIDGCDVSVDAIRWDGFFFAGAYKVILPKAKGISVLRESIDAPELVEAARRMLDAVDYRGVCGFDFRVAEDGRAYFLECNPRFSGGLRSQTASGFDMPWLLWRAANGLPLEVPRFRPGVRTQYIGGTVDYLRRRRRQGRLRLADVLQCLFSGAFHFD